MVSKAEKIAKILHNEVVVHQTPGFTPYWDGQPMSYHQEAMQSPIVLAILRAVEEEDYDL